MSKSALAGVALAALLAAPFCQAMSLREACRVTPAGDAVHEGETVELEGVANCGTGALFAEKQQKLFIQDAASGITIFSRQPLVAVHAGDRLRVIGTLTLYGGAVEIVPHSLAVLAHEAPPRPISVRSEQLLSPRFYGRLVQTTSTVVGTTTRLGSMNISLHAGEQLLTVHLTESQVSRFEFPDGIFDEGATLRVTGIASHYDVDPPYRGGWQIQPRTAADLVPVRAAPIITLHELTVAGTIAAIIVLACLAGIIFTRLQVRRQNAKLAESEERYRLAFEENVAGLYRTTLEGRILACNEAVARFLGTSREDIVGRSVRDFYVDGSQLQHIARELRARGNVTDIEIQFRRYDGRAVWALATANLIETAGGETVIDGTLIDIDDRKRAVQRVEYLAYHDALTDLPNRSLFRDRVEMHLAHARREAELVAVLFLDVDRFKRINDTLGHSAGDALLQAVARRLRTTVRSDDTVARFGGDEFAILLTLRDIESAAPVAHKILRAIERPFDIGGQTLRVTASGGVAIHPADGEDCETLLKNADAAMYRAKDAGRNRIEFVSSSADAALALERLLLENELRSAIEHNEIEVWYQPQISAKSGGIVGAEALARWMRGPRGPVEPSIFIAIAEEIGAIDDLGARVLEQACAQRRAWNDIVPPEFTIAVNVSAHQLRDDRFGDLVAAVTAKTGVAPQTIELELTESAALSRQLQHSAALARLRELGIGISIDDFGTGHSSLANIRQLPVRTLKIDGSFVADVAVDPNDAAIVAGIVEMAHGLGCRAVAEGVESEAQRTALQDLRCDALQGFLFSKAVPAAEFEVLLQQSAFLMRSA
jgi:diguanylate cyclase (GGDEF)-like protein/PAS domain S-box-containing protein